MSLCKYEQVGCSKVMKENDKTSSREEILHVKKNRRRVSEESGKLRKTYFSTLTRFCHVDVTKNRFPVSWSDNVGMLLEWKKTRNLLT